MIRPQSMLLTLYGDYVRQRGGEVWVGSLIRIAAQFGLSEGALRSALSRMARAGWLRFRRDGRRSYYSLTPAGRRLLDEGAQRIFERRTGPWDGRWRLLVYSIPEQQRAVRDQLRKRLAYLGFGLLSNGAWITPHDLRPQVAQLVDELGVSEHVELFVAEHLGFAEARDLAARCWDLDEIARRYRAFVERYRPAEERDRAALARGNGPDDAACFVRRFLLIHEYRRFFFLDPELPRELLPSDWPGWEAAELFQAYHRLLAERANRYVDGIFGENGPAAATRPERRARRVASAATWRG